MRSGSDPSDGGIGGVLVSSPKLRYGSRRKRRFLLRSGGNPSHFVQLPGKKAAAFGLTRLGRDAAQTGNFPASGCCPCFFCWTAYPRKRFLEPRPRRCGDPCSRTIVTAGAQREPCRAACPFEHGLVGSWSRQRVPTMVRINPGRAASLRRQRRRLARGPRRRGEAVSSSVFLVRALWVHRSLRAGV